MFRTWTADDEVTIEDNAETRTVYTYDSLGRLDSVTLDRRDGAPRHARDDRLRLRPAGQSPPRAVAGRGVSDYTYDPLNRLDLLRQFKDGLNSQYENVYESGVDTLLAEYDYDLAADGRRTGVTEKTPRRLGPRRDPDRLALRRPGPPDPPKSTTARARRTTTRPITCWTRRATADRSRPTPIRRCNSWPIIAPAR